MRRQRWTQRPENSTKAKDSRSVIPTRWLKCSVVAAFGTYAASQSKSRLCLPASMTIGSLSLEERDPRHHTLRRLTPIAAQSWREGLKRRCGEKLVERSVSLPGPGRFEERCDNQTSKQKGERLAHSVQASTWEKIQLTSRHVTS